MSDRSATLGQMSRRALVTAAGVAGVLIVLLVLAAVLTGRDGGEEAYCRQAAALAATNPSGVLGQFDLDDPDGNAEAAAGTVQALRALRQVAPGAIEEAAATVADTTSDLVDALTDLETDPSGARARLDELKERYEAFTAASGRLLADVRERCDVSLDGQQAAPTTTAPG
jgi:hypothetical protein